MEKTRKIRCCLCGKVIEGEGNNPQPLAPAIVRCCDDCNSNKVIPARIDRMIRGGDAVEMPKPSQPQECL